MLTQTSRKRQGMTTTFNGSKLILFIGERLVILGRDHTPGIPWPGYLDLPGGGREGDESPETCALRETCEETGLWLEPSQLVWRRALDRDTGRIWFFAAHLPEEAKDDIVFGDEGLGWWLMKASDVIAEPMMIPHFADHIRLYLGRDAPQKPRITCRRPAPEQGGMTISLWTFALLERTIRDVLGQTGGGGLVSDALTAQVTQRLLPEERSALGSVSQQVMHVRLELEVRGTLRRLDAPGLPRLVLSDQAAVRRV